MLFIKFDYKDESLSRNGAWCCEMNLRNRRQRPGILDTWELLQ